MNIGKIIKLAIVIFLAMLLFHPLATIFFMISHFGLFFGIGIVYAVIRILLGMSIISFFTKRD